MKKNEKEKIGFFLHFNLFLSPLLYSLCNLSSLYLCDPPTFLPFFPVSSRSYDECCMCDNPGQVGFIANALLSARTQPSHHIFVTEVKKFQRAPSPPPLLQLFHPCYPQCYSQETPWGRGEGKSCSCGCNHPMIKFSKVSLRTRAYFESSFGLFRI